MSQAPPRKAAIASLVLGLLTGVLPFGSASAQIPPVDNVIEEVGAVLAPAASPAGHALVVTSNLQEAFGEADVNNHDDMRVYVRRLLDQAPHAPDVLLLQEVRGSSVRFVAQLLGKKTGTRYAIVVQPGAGWTDNATHVIDTETSVVINTKTIGVAHDGGFISTRYKSSDGAAGVKPKIKNHAFALLTEKATGWRFAVASVHLIQTKFLRSWEIANSYRRHWSRKVADSLVAKYPQDVKADAYVIGGDFNSARCSMETGICPMPFWKTLVSGYDYRDANYVLAKAHGVDFVFATGGLVEAGSDEGYSPKREFYSDHKFRWAVLKD